MPDAKKFDRVYEMLLNETELLAEEGVEPADMARGLAVFLVQLTFDCAPSSDHAMHLIMSAVMRRLEANIEGDDDDE